MRYVEARIKKEQRAEICRIYVTDCLQIIAENTAKAVNGQYLTKRWYDIVDSKAETDDRSGAEIAVDVIKRLGLTPSKSGDVENEVNDE